MVRFRIGFFFDYIPRSGEFKREDHGENFEPAAKEEGRHGR
jgi:hypothetical protein